MQSFSLRVKALTRHNPECLSIELDVPDLLRETFAFQAGQYITLELPGKKGPIRRAYSLSSAPYEGKWVFTVKKQPRGQATTFLHNKLKSGDMLNVFPPLGKFSIEPNPDRRRGYYFVAAGSGITPVIAMIKALLEDEPLSHIYLLYGSRHPDLHLFGPELRLFAKRHEGQIVIRDIFTRPEGNPSWLARLTGKKATPTSLVKDRINEDSLTQFYEQNPCPIREQFWYLCGPGPMMALCESTLRNLKVPGERIFKEHFDADPIPASVNAVAATLEISRFDQITEVNIQAGQTLLEGMLAAGFDAPWSCSSGACASCMAHLESGQVDMPHAPALDAHDIEEGMILTCQSRPLSATLAIKYPN
jgi:ring-1,2-phenylacetyl-CoA epoxidase subunit PaaE